jgi:NADH dehydrogenase
MYLITGGTGFIGRHLVKGIQQQGVKIRALVRSCEIDDIYKNGSIEFFTADLLRPETLIDLTKDIDVVIHLAGVTHALDNNAYSRINVEGTRSLVSACKKNKIRKIIYISTRAISPSGGFYSISKMKAEQIIRNSSINFTILRLAEVYGGNKDKGIEHLISMIKKLSAIPIIGNGEYRLQPVYVEDVVSAIISACKSDKTNFKTYNVGGPDIFTYNNLVKLICEAMNLKRRLIHVPAVAVLAFAYFSSFVLKKIIIYPDQIPRLISPKDEDIGKAVEDLRYNPIGFREGLRLILDSK